MHFLFFRALCVASLHLALLVLLATGHAAAADPPLAGYRADPARTSVSGLSSGAFMAVQLQVAYSRTFIGTGVVAGGPYYCAAETLLYVGVCMGQVAFFPPNPYLLRDAAKRFVRERRIDGLGNLSDRKIYVFSGTEDSKVGEQAVAAAASFFRLAGVKAANIKYENRIPAGHAIIARSGGNACAANDPPYISHCTFEGRPYDQAEEIFRHVYGEPLEPRVANPGGRIVRFDQRAFANAASGMAETGFLYVPDSCMAAGARCRIHVALHGCTQQASDASFGDKFYRNAGYNHWADSNRILVLYPQVDRTDEPYNPRGCWDWWGYTGSNYAVRSGPQMKAIKAMIDRLAQ